MHDFNHLAFAYDKPEATARFKASPDDFRVDEILGFELTGVGEHQFLRIEKRGLNTEELVKSVSKAVKKPIKNISYAGLKDRQALTTQWLSVHCPGEEIIDADQLQGSGWRVIETTRHLKKLKKGALEGNKFSLILRDLTGRDEVEVRLQKVKAAGVPNYFGAQRFGHHGQNILKAEEVLLKQVKVKDHFLRGIYYSAARSFLFNKILSERVINHCWDKALAGDVMQLSGSNSVFSINTLDDVILSRVENHDISPAAPLWGRGAERVALDALLIQQTALRGFETWCDALEQHGLERSYRAQILQVNHMDWDWQATHLHLSFNLTAGAYATSVLRELLDVISS